MPSFLTASRIEAVREEINPYPQFPPQTFSMSGII
jgi:hypothetical protein